MVPSNVGGCHDQSSHAVLQPRNLAEPLLGETIGANLTAHRGRARRPGGAGGRAVRAALDLCAVRRGHRHAGPGPDRGGDQGGRPGRHLGAELRRVGAAAVRHGQGGRRSWSTSTRPTAATSWATCCASPASGCWSARSRFKTSDYRAMIEEVSGDLPDLQRVIYLGSTDWDELFVAGAMPAAGGGGPAGRAGGRAGLRRPDQHPVHQRHHRVPQGRHAVPPQHPEQRVLHRRGLPATPRPTGSASRCRSTTASAWCWATWPAPRTAPRS